MQIHKVLRYVLPCTWIVIRDGQWNLLERKVYQITSLITLYRALLLLFLLSHTFLYLFLLYFASSLIAAKYLQRHEQWRRLFRSVNASFFSFSHCWFILLNYAGLFDRLSEIRIRDSGLTLIVLFGLLSSFHTFHTFRMRNTCVRHASRSSRQFFARLEYN